MEAKRLKGSDRRLTQSTTSMNDVVKYSDPLPIDLIIEILLKLPAKYIARCRCISKLWSSVSGCPYFTELFLTRSLARPHLLFFCKNKDALCFFSSPQPQNLDVNSSLVALTQLTRFPYDYYDRICNPVHGLVCQQHWRRVKGMKENVLVICNPSTGRSLNLPIVKTRSELSSFLGYDPIDKQFKVLTVQSSYARHEEEVLGKHQALTLRIGELSWIMIECTIPHHPYGLGICINGVLYYTAYHESLYTDIIVCFVEEYSWKPRSKLCWSDSVK